MLEMIQTKHTNIFFNGGEINWALSDHQELEV